MTKQPSRAGKAPARRSRIDFDALFEVVGQISAADAAQRAGLPIRQKGSRYWTRCPFHGERDASLCLYPEPERGWVCFGCHKGGDAVALYAALYSLTRIDAAKKLAGEFGITVPEMDTSHPPVPPQPRPYNLQRALEKLRDRDYDRMCRALHQANSILEQYHDDTAWDDPRFVSALRARSAANDELDWLQQATLADLAEHYREKR